MSRLLTSYKNIPKSIEQFICSFSFAFISTVPNFYCFYIFFHKANFFRLKKPLCLNILSTQNPCEVNICLPIRFILSHFFQLCFPYLQVLLYLFLCPYQFSVQDSTYLLFTPLQYLFRLFVQWKFSWWESLSSVTCLKVFNFGCWFILSFFNCLFSLLQLL